MERENLKFVVLGHVDHGKSTLIGRLLYDTGSLSEQKMAELRQISAEAGSETEFAFLLDQFEEERLNRTTIDSTQVFFKTELRDYVIIDAPGHKQFLKNMITGTSQADAAVLVVDATEGLGEQTYRHLHMLKILGLEKILVLINKMDLVGFERELFEALLIEALSCLRRFDLWPLAVIPVSARNGDNLTGASSRMPWYDGPAFLTALDQITLPMTDRNQPLRLPVQDVYKVDGENVSVGQIVSGDIHIGQEVLILPCHRNTQITIVRGLNKKHDKAVAGQSIGISFENGVVCQRGQIVCSPQSRPLVSDMLTVNVFWMGSEPLGLGDELTLRLATQEVPCKVERIANRTDSASLETLEDKANELADTEVARLILRSEVPVCADSFGNIKEMGRLILLRGADIVAGGTIP